MRKRKSSGQITVFLSLLLMILISFLCTAVASAQKAGSRYLFSLASEAVTRSMFGAYDTRLWEQYRVLGISQEELATAIGEQCAQAYEAHGTLFSLDITSVAMEDPVRMGDQGALAWEESVISYMETRLPVDVAAGILEQVGVLEDLEQVIAWVRGLKDLIQPIVQLEKRLCQLEESLSEAQKTYQRGKGLLEELQKCSQIISENMGQEGVLPEQLEVSWNQWNHSYEKIQSYLEESGWQLEQVTTQAQAQVNQGTGLVSQICQCLTTLEGKESYGLASLADLGGYTGSLRQRFEDIQRLPGQLEEQQQLLQQIGEITSPSWEDVVSGTAKESLDEIQQLLEGTLEDFAGQESVTVSWGAKDPQWQEGEDAKEIQDAGENLHRLSQVKDWLDQGILSLVIEDPEQVSSAVLGRTMIPDKREGTTDGEDGAYGSSTGLTETISQAYGKILYGEYAIDHTAHYGQKESSGLVYETEQLIAGKGKDTANLAAVASRLLLVRGAMNLIFLLQHGGYRETLQTTATALCAALGGWIPQGLMVVMLMILWAMAEAVCDVRALLLGKSVAFWKEETSWKLAWEHWWTIWEEGFVTGLEVPSGMDYEGYLRFFLWMVPMEDACYRTMEVAEENLRKEQEGLCLDQVIYKGTVTVKARVAGQDKCLALTHGYADQ